MVGTKKKNSRKANWVLVAVHELWPVIEIALHKHLCHGEGDNRQYVLEESCYAVTEAICEEYNSEYNDHIVDAYFKFASSLGLKTFSNQNERIIWLTFLVEMFKTDNYVLKQYANTNISYKCDYGSSMFVIERA